MNHGKGSALHVQLDLRGLRRGPPLSGGPSEGTFKKGLRNLMPDDGEMVGECYGHENMWLEVWGTIMCVDIEGRPHESWRKQGDEVWTHRGR